MQQTNLKSESVGINSVGESLPIVRNPNLWRRISLRLTPRFVQNARQILRDHGFRGVVKAYGWKTLGAIFAYYLVRDSILYLLIPYLVAKGLF